MQSLELIKAVWEQASKDADARNKEDGDCPPAWCCPTVDLLHHYCECIRMIEETEAKEELSVLRGAPLRVLKNIRNSYERNPDIHRAIVSYFVQKEAHERPTSS